MRGKTFDRVKTDLRTMKEVTIGVLGIAKVDKTTFGDWCFGVAGGDREEPHMSW
jgi:hypothetical protein